MTPLRRCLPPFFALFLLLPLACMPVKPLDVTDDLNGNLNVRFGMPGPAANDPRSLEAFLIDREQYVLSYNDKTRTPNWVAWRLLHEDIGNAKRGPFSPDPRLPEGFARVTSHVYDGSGFDRGHMCPAQDRSSTQHDMDATFYMTNVVPQSPHCNQRGWERLESYCRGLTKDGHVLWICAGPAGKGGEGKNGRAEEIAHQGLTVTVPAKVWKVILVLPDEQAEPTKRTRTIAVVMPNDQSVDYDWPKYRVAVAEVEQLTGLNFWPKVPEETARVLKEKVDEVKVHVSHPRKED
jgi:endonuclease G, mitochondrial